MRRRTTLALLIGTAVLIPAGLHVGLALLIHNRIAVLPEDEAAAVRLNHDGVTVGPFARSVTIENPRVGVADRQDSILNADSFRLERASWLAGWLWDGRFDLIARLRGMDQDTEWLKRQGAGDEQHAVIAMLGFDDGTGDAQLRLAYRPDQERFTSAFRYGAADDEARFAALTVVAEAVDASALEALAEMRMPDVDSARVKTRYGGEAIREAVAELGARTRLSEPTLLRLLAVPAPYQWVADRLANEQLHVERLHLAPLLSGVQADAVRRPTRNTAGTWRAEQLRLGGLHLASSDDGLMVQGLNLKASGLRVPSTVLRPDVSALLREADYNEPTLDFELNYRHAPTTGNLKVAPLTVEAKAMGHLDAELSLSDVDPARLIQRPMEALIGGAFEELALRYTDNGLARRLRETLDNRPSDVEALRRRLRAWLQTTTGSRASGLTAAAERFLDNPGHLTIRANPEAPVPIRVLAGLAAMGRHAAISERLGLTAEANPKRD